MDTTKIIKVNPIYPEESLIKEAADIISKGGLVAFPTETVYGLGGDAFNRDAVIKIFKAKRRPIDNPLIVHIASVKQLEELTEDLPQEALLIAQKLWPGPITILVKKSNKVLEEVSASLPTVAIRFPAHPIAIKLIEFCGKPIAAPSANLTGKPSPTTAKHVIDDLMGTIDMIIDGDETLFGVESTIINLTSKPPTLLRPGPITPRDLEGVLGARVEIPPSARGIVEAELALAPGMKYKHYAPKARMIVVETGNYQNLTRIVSKIRSLALDNRKAKVGILCCKETFEFYRHVPAVKVSLGSRSNPYEVAKNLFASLRRFDDEDVEIIFAEGYEEKGLGLTIMNRLRKASGFNIVKV
ncbi:threonylcarbamoyl-AMP synthase [Candidatus Bathyarchaeota archaeon]|nr:threonylcarbamoyl-AMP synthase [Candidatus Bathyarchaeota archaeon]